MPIAVLLLLIAQFLPANPVDTARAVRAIDRIVPSLDGTLTGDRRSDAALMLVWGHAESDFRPCVVGDGGKSVGLFQLQDFDRACDVDAAAVEWLRRARESVRLCAYLPQEERLAALASGSCDRGRVLARGRVAEAKAMTAVLSW